MAKSKKESVGAIVVTNENIAELCEMIPTGRPTSEFASSPGVVFTTETEAGVVKHYAFVGDSVVEKDGVWSVEPAPTASIEEVPATEE